MAFGRWEARKTAASLGRSHRGQSGVESLGLKAAVADCPGLTTDHSPLTTDLATDAHDRTRTKATDC